MSFTDWPWRHWRAQFADKPALRLNDEVLSWQQLCARVDRLAAEFHLQGVEEGDAEVRLPDLGPRANNGHSDRARIEQVFRFHLLPL